jgi:hypothetical protein
MEDEDFVLDKKEEWKDFGLQRFLSTLPQASSSSGRSNKGLPGTTEAL